MKKSTAISIVIVSSIVFSAYLWQQEKTRQLYESRRMNLVHLRDREFSQLGFDEENLIKSRYVLLANCNSLRSQRIYTFPEQDIFKFCKPFAKEVAVLNYKTFKTCHVMNEERKKYKKNGALEVGLGGLWAGGRLIKPYQGKAVGEFAAIVNANNEEYLADDYQEKKLSILFTVIDKGKSYFDLKMHQQLTHKERLSPQLQHKLVVITEWQIMLDGKAYRKNRGTNENNDCRVYDAVEELSMPENSL